MVKKTRRELAQELRSVRAQKAGKCVTEIMSKLITAGGYVACIYFVYRMVEKITDTVHELAGKTTIAQITQEFKTDIGIRFPELLPKLLESVKAAEDECKKIIHAGDSWAITIGIPLSVLGVVAIWSSILYAGKAKRLRQETIMRCEGRIRGLEIRRDPERSSSGLGQSGDTHKRDL